MIRLLPVLASFVVMVALAAESPHQLAHTAMHQEQHAVPEGVPVPELGLELYADESDGYNLRILVRNFLMESPVDASDDGNLRGHAHLYLNGVKLTRVYGTALHLPARLFKQGINSLQLSINDHDHRVWAINREVIQATILMNPDLEPFLLSHYSSSPISE